jgi:anti-sigma factor RsiW
MTEPIAPKQYDAATETLMDAYLRGEMSPEKLKAFENRMAREPELWEEVSLRRDIIIGIRAAEHKHIRRLLDNPHLVQQSATANGQHRTTQPGSKRVPLWVWLVAAAIGAAVAAVVVFS